LQPVLTFLALGGGALAGFWRDRRSATAASQQVSARCNKLQLGPRRRDAAEDFPIGRDFHMKPKTGQS
jgi:hypothetical protein